MLGDFTLKMQNWEEKYVYTKIDPSIPKICCQDAYQSYISEICAKEFSDLNFN